jgi:hypothetical protein
MDLPQGIVKPARPMIYTEPAFSKPTADIISGLVHRKRLRKVLITAAGVRLLRRLRLEITRFETTMSARTTQLNRSRYTAWAGLLVVGAALGAAGCSDEGSSSAPKRPDPVQPGSPDPANPEPGPIGPGPEGPVDLGPGPDDLPIVDVPIAPDTVGGFKPSEKLDLLFVVDNSVSMGDKQALFKEAVGDMIDQLVNPPCLDSNTNVFVPKTETGGCPAGAKRIFDPVKDIHIGMLTSSLGPRGALGDEVPYGCGDSPRGNDKAHLLPFVREGLMDASSNGQGFLVWDPDGKQNPPGETDIATLITKFQAQVDAVGEDGCGFEAPLEAAYRFLVEPEPYETIGRVPCPNAAPDDPPTCAAPQGVDQALLQQRAAFIRPDSVVVVMYLTDENDCSVRTSGHGYFAFRPAPLMPAATAACETNPNSECCLSCTASPESIPASCTAEALACPEAPGETPESYNIRCFDQKRRFGVDLLRSTDIYSQGFTRTRVGNRAGEPVDNPLVTAERGKEKVFVVGIVGVPWQSTATEGTLNSPNDLDLRRSDQTDWANFLGDNPGDAFNKESLVPRQGSNPFTSETLGGPGTWNAINGHERPLTSNDGLDDDLQYSCIFPLDEPRDCTAEGVTACDCYIETVGDTVHDYTKDNPLCLDPVTKTYSTTQYYAKAYPAPRIIEVLQDVGPQGVLASICPKQSSAKDQQDYVYRPVIRALLLNVARQVAK